jgi:hypothetical protein
LEKGKPFRPDVRQTKILTDAALVGEAMAKANSRIGVSRAADIGSDAHWDFALQLDADDPEHFWNLLDERASWFYEAVGAGAAMAPKRPGPFIRLPQRLQGQGRAWLDGGRSYRLRVPPNPPIKLFWSVTVYDVDTRALILNEQKIADRSSRMDLRENKDGSVDIYCGPKRRPASRRTGFRPFPARTGLRISVSTSLPKPTSIGPGHWQISSKCSWRHKRGKLCPLSISSPGSSS